MRHDGIESFFKIKIHRGNLKTPTTKELHIIFLVSRYIIILQLRYFFDRDRVRVFRRSRLYIDCIIKSIYHIFPLLQENPQDKPTKHAATIIPVNIDIDNDSCPKCYQHEY